MDSIKDWLSTHGLKILVIAAVTWAALHFGTRIIRSIVHRTVKMEDEDASPRAMEMRERTLTRILGALYKTLVIFIALMMILSELGVNVAPLFAGAGIVSLAVGFGAQDLVKDIVAGIFILFENQYRVGDVVELAGYSGTVEKMTLRVTVIRSLDGNVHYIPNGSVEQATNKTMDFSKINLDIGVSYDANIDNVEKIINSIGEDMAQDDKWKADILEAPHFLRVNDLSDSAVEIKVIGKTVPEKQWGITGELRKRILKEFGKSKISIPYPQIVVHKPK